jgi:hypothetical protein
LWELQSKIVTFANFAIFFSLLVILILKYSGCCSEKRESKCNTKKANSILRRMAGLFVFYVLFFSCNVIKCKKLSFGKIPATI